MPLGQDDPVVPEQEQAAVVVRFVAASEQVVAWARPAALAAEVVVPLSLPRGQYWTVP